MRLLFDENFDQRILRGLRLQIPNLDYLVVQEINLSGQSDAQLLAWAAENQRIIVTRDVGTMPKYAYERIKADEPVAGVIIVPKDLALGLAIEELVMLIECCEPGEFVDQVQYLPI